VGGKRLGLRQLSVGRLGLGLVGDGAVQQLALDDLLRPDRAALADAGALAHTAARVVELRAPYLAAGGHLDLLDLRRMQRERALDADAERLLADREGLAHAVALALDHDALEHLRAATRALDHLEVDPHAVARVERREAAQLRALEALDDRAHGVESGGTLAAGCAMVAEGLRRGRCERRADLRRRARLRHAGGAAPRATGPIA